MGAVRGLGGTLLTRQGNLTGAGQTNAGEGAALPGVDPMLDPTGFAATATGAQAIGAKNLAGTGKYNPDPLTPLIGAGGGANGTGYAPPKNADLQAGTTAQQTQAAQGQANNSLNGQAGLLAALQQQNAVKGQSQVASQQADTTSAMAQNQGIANQGNVFTNTSGLNNQLGNAGGVNAQMGALSQQQALNQGLAGGVGTQNQAVAGLQGVAGQQQATAAQLQGIANGTGPNPAQAALNQATGQNVANQAALMAGQRGASANVGLMARQAAEQGANTQQQAVGQGATMQAQQQLGALGQMTQQQQAQAGTQQAIGSLGTTQAALQQSGIGQQAGIGAGLTTQQQQQQQMLAAQASNQVSQQQAALAAQAAQANTMAGQQINQTNANTAGALQNVGQQQTALGNLNNAGVSSQNSVNAGNTSLANTNIQGQQGLIGGAMKGMAVGASLPGKAYGGPIDYYAEGGQTPLTPPPTPMAAEPGPSSDFGRFLQSSQGVAPSSSTSIASAGSNPGATALFEGAAKLTEGPTKAIKQMMQQKGGSGSSEEGTDILDNAAGVGTIMMMANKGGLAKGGGNVATKASSQKAVKGGDSYNNDKIPTMLSEGEIVLPRSVTMSSDPVRSSADFVAKVLAKRRGFR